ncbi:MAG: hypothetical protein ACRDHM_07455 [Actinomycetota bacterium]
MALAPGFWKPKASPEKGGPMSEDYLAGLKQELSYYERTGDKDRAAGVQKEITRTERELARAPKTEEPAPVETGAAPPAGETIEAPQAEAAPKRTTRRTSRKQD